MLPPLGTALGRWPVPKLDTQARFCGLTTRQWLYVGVAYQVWEWGAPLVAVAPLTLRWTWLALCILLGLAGVLVRWHGRDLWGAWSIVLAHQSAPPLAVWRPLDATWLAAAMTPMEDDDADFDDSLDEAVATDANPYGWQLDRRTLAGVAAAA